MQDKVKRRRNYKYYKFFNSILTDYKDKVSKTVLIEIVQRLYNEMNNSYCFGYRRIASSAYESMMLAIEDHFPEYIVAEEL